MFGERIRSLRKERNLTQEELCNLIDIKRSVFTKYELEQVAPSIDTLIKLGDFFEVSIDYLVGRTDVRHKDYAYEKDLISSFISQLNNLPVEQNTTELYSFLVNFGESLKQYCNNEEMQLLFKSVNSLVIYRNDLLILKKTNPKIDQKVLSYYQESIKQVVDSMSGILNSIYHDSLSESEQKDH